MGEYYFHLDQLTVGYNGKPLIDQIQVGIHKGEIVTLIGPNGSGKSTILKSITRQLKILGGKVLYEENDLHKLSYKELSMVLYGGKNTCHLTKTIKKCRKIKSLPGLYTSICRKTDRK